jgi:hypothetical protein
LTNEPETSRPDNLFNTVDGDYGAHGRFDDVSREKSLYWWVETHKVKLLGVAVGGVFWTAFLAAFLIRARHRPATTRH